jgi:hypothetical protein
MPETPDSAGGSGAGLVSRGRGRPGRSVQATHRRPDVSRQRVLPAVRPNRDGKNRRCPPRPRQSGHWAYIGIATDSESVCGALHSRCCMSRRGRSEGTPKRARHSISMRISTRKCSGHRRPGWGSTLADSLRSGTSLAPKLAPHPPSRTRQVLSYCLVQIQITGTAGGIRAPVPLFRRRKVGRPPSATTPLLRFKRPRTESSISTRGAGFRPNCPPKPGPSTQCSSSGRPPGDSREERRVTGSRVPGPLPSAGWSPHSANTRPALTPSAPADHASPDEAIDDVLTAPASCSAGSLPPGVPRR